MADVSELVQSLAQIEERAKKTLDSLNNGSSSTGASGVQAIWYMARDAVRHATGVDPALTDRT